jgi:hypothetical protein
MAPTEGMPVAPAPTAAAAPAIPSPPAAALPPAPPREQPAGNNKGLIYGLSGVGAVLLIAMGVVALRSDRGGSEAPAPIDVAPPTTSATPNTEPPPETPPATEPETPPDEPEPTAASPEPSERPKPAGTTKPASTKPTPAPPAPKPTQPAQQTTPPAPPPATPTTPTPKPPVQQPAPPVAQPTPPVSQPAPQPAPAPAGGDACVACVQAAGRDILAASQAYSQCRDDSLRKKCTTRAAGTAPTLATNAARNQRCPEAKAIIQAALAMGVPPGRLATAQNLCK